MANEIIDNAKEKMKQSLASLQRDLAHIRAGRANASLLDRIQVVYYGAPTPLNQLASVTVPEARVLMVTPFDKTILKDIEKALYESDLGITPANDGSVIRLVIPMLTEERRKELVKDMGKFIEASKVAIRNVRRDAMDTVKKQEKAKEITEDERKAFEKDIQKITDDATNEADRLASVKEKELLDI